ncbi:ABC transporter ATP-binding protein [Litchfieldella qijiaojingensis]|uniref:ABC transporter ATP-binding protein n=1 Tax=Litchfieldella qijiaojingensis TaxID=980347 RepID=A0ABQ2YBZ3_9GAMM|nr:ABC transporter substrate-binding protein [Halomonas qijiaojingensis]GGX78582.1 ABC transporter ATP-binding protein [Halomonas qijiaojingensis]
MTSMQRRVGGVCLALLLALSVGAPLLADRPDADQVDATALEAASRIASGWTTLKGGPGVDTPGFPADAPVAPSLILRAPEPIAPPPVRELSLVLDWYLSPQHAALIVARERGDFDRQGLKVSISAPADPSVPTKLVAASRADLALGRQLQLHRQIDEGLPLIRVATLVGTPLNSLVVREGNGIANLTDLSGKTIGYATRDDIQPTLSIMLAHHGLALDDVTLEGLDFTLAPALVEGRVDAVIGGMRHVMPYQLREEGVVAHSFMVEDHGLPRYDELILMANRDHLNGQRDDIRRLVAALEDATHWIINHPNKAWELVTRSEPGLDTAANRQAWPEILRRLSLRPATLDARHYLNFQAFLHDQGLITKRQPIERLAVDLSAP